MTILFISHMYFYIQDIKMFDKEKEISISGVNVKENQTLDLSIEDKIAIINSDKDVERVALKTGDIYSLYEARKQCFTELSKIPSLKIDLYGPTYEEIKLKPYLLINAKTPSQTMLVWIGEVIIQEVSYHVVLDEGSGKINIEIQKSKDEEFKSKLDLEWKHYLDSAPN